MKAGHIFTIEPMINLGDWKVCMYALTYLPTYPPTYLPTYLLPHPPTYVPTYLQCDTWPDQWSAVTTDGSRSAQFEHTILVTDSGYELLTAR